VSILFIIDKDLILADKGKKYHPIVYMNDFWQLSEHELEINKTSKYLFIIIYTEINNLLYTEIDNFIIQ